MNNWKIAVEIYATETPITERREAHVEAPTLREAHELFAETLWPQMRPKIQNEYGHPVEYRITSVDPKATEQAAKPVPAVRQFI